MQAQILIRLLLILHKQNSLFTFFFKKFNPNVNFRPFRQLLVNASPTKTVLLRTSDSGRSGKWLDLEPRALKQKHQPICVWFRCLVGLFCEVAGTETQQCRLFLELWIALQGQP